MAAPSRCAECGPQGVCDEVHGRCQCQLGWGGPTCETVLQPACSLGEQEGRQLRVPCAGVRAVSPVACECLVQCLATKEEVCGHASVGCNDEWKKGPATSRSSLAFNLTYKPTFYAMLTCIAVQKDVRGTSAPPFHTTARLTTFASYLERGYSENDATVPRMGPVPAYGAGLHPPMDWRGGGLEPQFSPEAKWVWGRGDGTEAWCESHGGTAGVRRGCSGRGRCLLEVHDGRRQTKCVCVDGAYGANCEGVCDSDCVHHCSGHGVCLHGFCKCDDGWFGVDCSDTVEPTQQAIPRRLMHFDRSSFGPGPVGVEPRKLSSLPHQLRPHIRRLRQAVFVYDLPPAINREADRWMTRYWGQGCFLECDPVHTRRIYASQAHFDGHLLHDDYVRTLDLSSAKLFYVPTFLMARHTCAARRVQPSTTIAASHTPNHVHPSTLESLPGRSCPACSMTGAGSIQRTMHSAYDYIRFTYPYWNASGGRDHVWFIPGEKLTCVVPKPILAASIVVGHWGARKGFTRQPTDCVDPLKDIVVPPITPIQHDLAEYHRRLQQPLLAASAKSIELIAQRSGPLLLFAGGIVSFGASQERKRRGGIDSLSKQQKLQDIVTKESKRQCSDPADIRPAYCRGRYSMGVRQAVWRQRLWEEPDMKIVSAGIPNYLGIAATSRFCLHTEGNSWGTRLIDQMAIEGLPLIVNDGMIFPYENVLPREVYASFSIHLSKARIPEIATVLRNISNASRLEMHARLREHKRGFIWFRPEGLAYEYTLASLGERVISWVRSNTSRPEGGSRRRHGRRRAKGRGRWRRHHTSVV